MSNFLSPLRYPGGKGKLSNFIHLLMMDNRLVDGVYAEPYAGGSSVGLFLLLNEYVSRIYINDIDKSIYSFWYCVLNETDALCKLINDKKVTVKEWEKQKKIQMNKANHSFLEVAFSTFFLNRTNRSGIINAGIIGGKDQTGEWKIDARYNKVELISRIKKIALYRDRITLTNLDAIEFINSMKPGWPAKTLIYFDPPYYQKGKELYTNYYNHNDHVSVAKAVKSIKRQRWLVTYDNETAVKNLYTKFRQRTYLLNYSAASANIGKEIMIYSDNLAIPNIQTPTDKKEILKSLKAYS